MIKINLVKIGKGGALISPVSLSVGPGTGGVLGADQIQKQGILKAFLLVFGPLALWIYFEQVQNPDLLKATIAMSGEVTRLKDQNQKAADAVAATKNYEDQEKSIKTKIDVIDKLRRGRLLEVKILDTIQKGIPQRVWLSRLDFKDTRLQINGLAMDSNDVTSFEEQLRNSVFLKDPKTNRIVEASLDKGIVGKSFQIEATLETDMKNQGGADGK